MKKPTSFVDVVEEMRKLTKVIRERNELLIAKAVQDLTWEVNAAKDKIIESVRDELRKPSKVSAPNQSPIIKIAQNFKSISRLKMLPTSQRKAALPKQMTRRLKPNAAIPHSKEIVLGLC